jgi:hypothetical protein
MLNITKEVYQSRSNWLPKDIQRRRPQESAFRMSKGVTVAKAHSRTCNDVIVRLYLDEYLYRYIIQIYNKYVPSSEH